MSRTKHRGAKRGGGGGGGRGRGRGKGRGGGAVQWRTHERSNAQEIDRHNERYERYYNDLGIVNEDEREQFWESMRSDLPNSFRFAGSRGHALVVQRRLIDHYIPQITQVEFEDKAVDPPQAVSWYPDQLAWSMTTPKSVIRRFQPFASFQKFLVSENSIGNITRQELVSMIPPLFMDVRPGMTVLDLCAAPGSKSAQLIEMVHGGEEARIRKVLEKVFKGDGTELGPPGAEVKAEQDQAAGEIDYEDDGRSTGLLIANDKDSRRAQMLVHQCKRLNSPNLIVTNHDATMFPSIALPSVQGSARQYLKFDRVLADVPCSGDGTSRKNLAIWKEWIPGNGIGLHVMQIRILVRALQMLKVGGRVVYSTCSMNPIENEAVIAAAIERCGGFEKVQLVNVDDLLPGLKRRPGLTSWTVMDKQNRIWNSWEQLNSAKNEEGDEAMSKLTESMFPPPSELELPLQRCVRVYPHLQDTGGFFITVLEKQSEIRAKPENQPKETKNTAVSAAPITAIVNEMNENTSASTIIAEKLSTMDDIVPPQDASNDFTKGNVPPTARQNQANEVSLSESSKRHIDAADSLATSKRIKTRDDADEEATVQIEGERQVHYPPPPGAVLGLTSHSTPTPASAPAPSLTKPHPNGPLEEAFKYLSPSQSSLTEISTFYSISPRFPRDRFMVRNASGQPVKAIYYTSALARDILTANEGGGIKFVHCGVKMFVKQDVQGRDNVCAWRIQADGLPVLAPWVGPERVVRVSEPAVLHVLLKEMFPKIANGAWERLGEMGRRVDGMAMGCCVLRTEVSEDGFSEDMVMPLWRGVASLNLMLPKEERRAMLLRLFDDEEPLVDNSAGGRKDENGKVKVKDEVKMEVEDVDAAANKEDSDQDMEDGGVPLPERVAKPEA